MQFQWTPLGNTMCRTTKWVCSNLKKRSSLFVNWLLGFELQARFHTLSTHTHPLFYSSVSTCTVLCTCSSSIIATVVRECRVTVARVIVFKIDVKGKTRFVLITVYSVIVCSPSSARSFCGSYPGTNLITHWHRYIGFFAHRETASAHIPWELC